jgi:hypothetical protein
LAGSFLECHLSPIICAHYYRSPLMLFPANSDWFWYHSG